MTSRALCAALLATGAGLLLGPGAAQAASTASFANGKITWTGDDGPSKVYFRWDSDIQKTQISGDDVKAGPGCEDFAYENGDRGALCPEATSLEFNAHGGDDELISNFVPDMGPGKQVFDMGPGNDKFDGFGGRFVVHGGPGEDWLSGGDGNDDFYGDGDTDFLVGYHGADRLYGGEGDDILSGDGRTIYRYGDLMAGGPGNDRVADYTALNGSTKVASISFDDQQNDGYDGEQDQIVEMEGVEGYSPYEFTGSDGRDVAFSRELAYPTTLRGKGGDDDLEGSLGKDTIDGGAGKDKIRGDRVCNPEFEKCATAPAGGDDTILARDGEVDDISCGSGTDKVTADADDTVAADCETVDRPIDPKPTVTATPTVSPAPTVTPVADNGPSKNVSPDNVAGQTGKPGAGKFGLAGKAPKLAAALKNGLKISVPGTTKTTVRVLRNGKVVGTAKGFGTVTVKFDAKTKKALRKAKSAKFTIIAGSKTMSVTLKK